MSHWPATKARRVLAALLRIGWNIKRQSGSHRTLSRQGWPDFVFAFHDKFGEVIIPLAVSGELNQSNRPQAVHDFIASRPAWLLERVPASIEPIPALHAGELAAISLAQELKADLLLIDEVRARKAAAERHIPFTGTIGVLELAADRGLLDLQDAFARVEDDRLLDIARTTR